MHEEKFSLDRLAAPLKVKQVESDSCRFIVCVNIHQEPKPGRMQQNLPVRCGCYAVYDTR